MDDVTISKLTLTTNPNLSITPNTLNHGSSCVNTGATPVLYTITNTGTVAADGITVLSSNASEFTVSALSPTTVAANGGTATFNVTFTPSASGARSATITVATATAGGNSPTLALTGTGDATLAGAITTSAESNVASTAVRLNGNVTTLGTCPSTTEKGFVWGANADPTILDLNTSVAGLTTGAYFYDLTGLTPNTTYHYRAYIKDANGYVYGSDEAFTTLDVADHIAFVNVPSAGTVNSNLTAFTVEARTAGNVVDAAYAGNVTISKATGSGAISGTLTKAFVNGVATFNDIEFDAVDTYTLHADSGAFSQITSGNIAVAAAVIYTKINSLAELTDGDYVIANQNDLVAIGALGSSQYNAVTIYPQSGQLSNPDSGIIYHVESLGSGVFTFQRVATGNYIGWSSSTSLAAPTTANTNSQKWTVTYDNNNYFVAANLADATKLIRYNSGLTTPGFKAYAASSSFGSEGYLQFYKRLPSTWNGSGWSNGPPNANTHLIISANYDTTTQPDLVGNTITINNGGTLEIINGKSVTATSIIVNDGGNFIVRDGATTSVTNFTVNRNSASVANKYAFWSSPVSAANIYSVFPGFTPQYVMTYNTATDFYTVVPNPTATTAGTGYSVKIPATAPNLSFIGTPNNGIINTALSTVGNTYNLVGNPYPSNMDLPSFYSANSANIGSTLWFWDNTSNSVTTQTGNTTVNVGYATYNAAGSTWVAAPTSAAPTGNAAKIGQGFIVEALSTTLLFTNSMRVADSGVSLNKSSANAGEGKYWLKLSTPYNTYISQAVTYGQGASDTYDAYDSKAIATGSDAFYSTVGTEKLVIQGKADFDIHDVVPLGNKHFENGQFTIALTQKEGLFLTGQAIYLRDKLLGTETNLQNGAYTFTSDAGEFANRFEIVYKQSVLGTADTPVKNDLKVYRSGEDFVIDAPSRIQNVLVYDASGRLIQTVSSKSTTATVRNLDRGVYILQITTDAGSVSRKIVK
ncbi:MAG: choice-of-anchor D domain-containing protein [Weeksellaceae bacterium]|nr:choice-of-anchor D domain-containing protein [Weeksellaceae bacterium]